jgi:hypothetical protein
MNRFESVMAWVFRVYRHNRRWLDWPIALLVLGIYCVPLTLPTPWGERTMPIGLWLTAASYLAVVGTLGLPYILVGLLLSWLAGGQQ